MPRTTPEIVGHTSRLSAEGRLVVPAAIRRDLNWHPGDRMVFLIDGDEVRVTSVDTMVQSLWALNHGGDAGDSAIATRAARDADRATAEARFVEVMSQEVEDEPALTDRLLAELGLGQ